MSLLKWFATTYEEGTLPEPPFDWSQGVQVANRKFYDSLLAEVQTQQAFESGKRWAPAPRYRWGALQADLINLYRMTHNCSGTIDIISLHYDADILKRDRDAVYIGRGNDKRFYGTLEPSPLANPHNWRELGREEAVRRYSLKDAIDKCQEPIYSHLLMLAGKYLAGRDLKLCCYCPDEADCHGYKARLAIQYVAQHHLHRTFKFFEEAIICAPVTTMTHQPFTQPASSELESNTSAASAAPKSKSVKNTKKPQASGRGKSQPTAPA